MGEARFLTSDLRRYALLVESCVVPEAARCVQCGICAYNCPMGIDIRAYARQGLPIQRSQCLACGECVTRCPRGVLRFESTPLFAGRGRRSW